MVSQSPQDRIETLIADVESTSAVEVVVKFEKQASSYRDLDLFWGLLFAASLLSVKIWSNHHFHPDWVLVNLVFLGVVGYFLSSRIHGLRRLLLSKTRAEKGVQKSAYAAFTQLGVSQTRDRTGMLILVSRLERRLDFVIDSGLAERLHDDWWQKLRDKYGSADSDAKLLENLSNLLQELKAPLARHLPAAEDDVNELPDRPVEA